MARPQNNKAHIYQVDYIRAIASVSVAVFHLGGKVLPVLKYGWLGVQMFFVLSGFIICHSLPENYQLKDFGRFIIKRLARIEPPYIISIGLILLLNLIFLNHYQPDWINIAMHLAYLNSFFGKEYLSPVYWTLGIEFQFYLLIGLLYPLIKNNKGIWLVMALCSLSYFYIPYLPLGNVFSFFAMGILYHLYQKKKISGGIFGACLAIVSYIAVLKTGTEATVAGLAAIALLLLPLKSNRIISFLSAISFSLYLTHDRVGASLVVYLGTLLPKTLFCKGLIFITGIVVSIAFAWLFYKLAELPFVKLSKKLGYKSKDKTTAASI